MGREQDRVYACAEGTRRGLECRPIWIVTVHREPRAIEVPNRRLEDKKVDPSGWLAAVPVSGRVGGEVERIVQRIEIAARGDGRTCRVDIAVVAGRRRLLAHNSLHTPTMAVGIVFLDILNHIVLTFNWRISCERSRSKREAGPEGSPYAISKRGEVLRSTPVPGSQVFKQVREVHGCSMLEVAVGPLIGHAR